MGTLLERESWARQRGESHKAFTAWVTYRDFGPTRSYQRVSKELAKSMTLIKRWGSKWTWQDRAAAWDDECDRRQREKQLAAIEEMAERHAAAATMFQVKVIEKLNRMDDEEIDALTPSECINWMTAAAKLERLSRGEPEEIARLNHAGAEGNEPVPVPTVNQTVVVETVVRNKAELRAALRQAALDGIEIVTGNGNGYAED